MYNKICDTVATATEELPKRKAGNGPRRKVSAEETKSLYDQLTKLKNPTSAERKSLQKQIRESSLKDFKDWVEDCAEELTAANNVGNTKKIFEMVNTMEGKRKKPPKNLITNKQGQLLTCATEVPQQNQQ